MFINSFIYFYMGICILIILFEIGWKKYISIRKNIINIVRIRLKNKTVLELEKHKNKKRMSEQYFIMIERKLRRINNLISFEKACDEIAEYKNMEYYFEKMIPVFENLISYYSRNCKDEEKAYLATIIRKYYRNFKSKEKLKTIITRLYEFLDGHLIYCKINTIDSICQIGDIKNVIRVLDIINENQYHFNLVLLANGLINTKQNRKELAIEMFKRFDTYDKNIQMAIIKYLNENPYIDEKDILMKLTKSKYDTDVRCEVMRYFQNHKMAEAKDYLVNQLTETEVVANDLIVKGIGTLGYYDEEEVRSVLEELTKSSDELIKESAYKSLEKIKNTQKAKIQLVI